jgi:hypothetical protein
LSLYKTRAIKETRLVLELTKTDTTKTTYSISNLNELESVINKLNSRFGENSLLQIYERERQHYILLLTVLAILLTVSIAYGVIKSFIDKNDLIYQEEKINELKNKLTKELKKFKINNIENDFSDSANKLVRGDKFANLNNKIVSNEEELLVLVKAISKPLFNLYRKKDVDKFPLRFIYDLRHLIIGTLKYSYDKDIVLNQRWSTKDNPRFKLLLIWIRDNFGDKKFEEIKERLCKIENVKWED